MNHKILKTQEYLMLQEKGIDINACEIDFKLLSVSCEDLSLYRKALRVKIRALLKEENIINLQGYIRLLYTLGHFSSYLYGFHSCSSLLESWQEELALFLQTKFDVNRVSEYDASAWIRYKSIEDYKKYFTKSYEEFSKTSQPSAFIQDAKPFLNLKDKVHFDTYLALQKEKND
ncbi:hypothetical protein JHD50_08200 [Sulfurimonas sp. MAG313]|nr:hypothetical protein [Sulfurimonas sp. MAG313]MDF1881281.1 hypothetical protein [Sulfurimonas sp. MAG313]